MNMEILLRMDVDAQRQCKPKREFQTRCDPRDLKFEVLVPRVCLRINSVLAQSDESVC